MTHEALVIRSLTMLFFPFFFLVLSVDESVLGHCQLSLFCYGDKTARESGGEKELDRDKQDSLEIFISFRRILSCLIAICYLFISDLNCHNRHYLRLAMAQVHAIPLRQNTGQVQ